MDRISEYLYRAARRAARGEGAADVYVPALAEEQNAAALLDGTVSLDDAGHVDEVVEHVLRVARRHQHRLAARGVNRAGVRDQTGDGFARRRVQLTGIGIAQGEIDEGIAVQVHGERVRRADQDFPE